MLGADIVCLAGYMRILTARFVESWEGRLINIHPALLPSFKGLDTHRRALEAGVRIHGCTVHFVTAETDDGPVIAQAAVPVLTGDSEADLAARVLKAEHELYPLALRLVAEGKASDGRRPHDFRQSERRRQRRKQPAVLAGLVERGTRSRGAGAVHALAEILRPEEVAEPGRPGVEVGPCSPAELRSGASAAVGNFWRSASPSALGVPNGRRYQQSARNPRETWEIASAD